MSSVEKRHALCIPFPAQGHINPMLKLAKLLHLYGFHITFCNTDYNHNRLCNSRGSSSIEGLNGFTFEHIPDGLPASDLDATQDVPSLCSSITANFPSSFRALLAKLNSPSSTSPPVSCIVSDGVMSFTLDIAKELRIPAVLFWTTSACGFMAYLHFQDLLDRGLVPLKEAGEVALLDGYLETPIDWVPGMSNMRLRDFPSFIRTTNPDDIVLNYVNREAQRSKMALGIVLNTYDDLEGKVLDAMASMLPPIYAIGPLSLLSSQMPSSSLTYLGSNLWKEESGCIQWLDEKNTERSVVYVNFGSTTVMSNAQLIEFAWGLANSGCDFLWVIRPDLVRGDAATLPSEFLVEVEKRGILAGWCPQEAVLEHPAIGGFLTHCGWNSTIESLCNGVPMICWPFFSEQQTNCRFVCTEWGSGMEITGEDVRRDIVEGMIRELMGGEKGKEMRKKAYEWKELAARATEPGGFSLTNLEKLVQQLKSID